MPGLLLGGVLPFVFCGLTMLAVGRAAGAVIQEVRRFGACNCTCCLLICYMPLQGCLAQPRLPALRGNLLICVPGPALP